MNEDAFSEQLAQNLPSDDLEQEKVYSHQIRQYSVLEAAILALLSVIVAITCWYLLTTPVVSHEEFLLFITTMLIFPSGVFLLFLHFYDLYAIFTKNKKLIPLVLDVFYLLCVPLMMVTVFSLDTFYTKYQLTSQFLSQGFFIAIGLLLMELGIMYLLARTFVNYLIAPRFSLLFPFRPRLFKRTIVVPTVYSKAIGHIFYLRKKPDQTHWEQEDCFVKYRS